ncbi:MAG: hypothetical protein H0V17_13635 [Deltaproteobacteria bacterium]|nr:hypothetical protein [Deltaproteobacteria bacterium]
MSCEMFIGTIVSCETRFRTAVTRAIVVDVVANWAVTIEVEEADPDAPAPPGGRVSFLFHSPTQLFLAPAEELAGCRYRFTIDRTSTADGVRWGDLRATPIR